MNKWHKNFTWLGWLNFLILQWFFIRLAKYKEILDFHLEEVSICQNGLGIGGKYERFKWKYKILKWIVPLTGWWNDYIYFFKKKS